MMRPKDVGTNMKIIACFALLLILTGVAGAEPQAIIETDFGVPGKPFETITAARGVGITGPLPDGWRDNSEWKSNVVAEYMPMSEGGRDFLRIEQASGDGLHFMHRLPPRDDANAYYRLTLTARSLTGVSLGIRNVGPPYSTLTSFTPATDGQWRDFFYDFRLSPHSSEIGLFVYLEGKGTLWLDGLQVEHGAKANVYAPQKPMEVSLALPPSDAASARVIFTDEPMKIQFGVAGQAQGRCSRRDW
jgi:hypothetical protein